MCMNCRFRQCGRRKHIKVEFKVDVGKWIVFEL